MGAKVAADCPMISLPPLGLFLRAAAVRRSDWQSFEMNAAWTHAFLLTQGIERKLAWRRSTG
jgi:hypothetical protein